MLVIADFSFSTFLSFFLPILTFDKRETCAYDYNNRRRFPQQLISIKKIRFVFVLCFGVFKCISTLFDIWALRKQQTKKHTIAITKLSFFFACCKNTSNNLIGKTILICYSNHIPKVISLFFLSLLSRLVSRIFLKLSHFLMILYHGVHHFVLRLTSTNKSKRNCLQNV